MRLLPHPQVYICWHQQRSQRQNTSDGVCVHRCYCLALILRRFMSLPVKSSTTSTLTLIFVELLKPFTWIRTGALGPFRFAAVHCSRFVSLSALTPLLGIHEPQSQRGQLGISESSKFGGALRCIFSNCIFHLILSQVSTMAGNYFAGNALRESIPNLMRFHSTHIVLGFDPTVSTPKVLSQLRA